MFENNQDFYPTPESVIKKMKTGLFLSGKTVFDPSSGKGDILKYCKERGATTVGCELSDDLYNISREYGRMIGSNFLLLKRIDITSVNVILMNPPFSDDVKHILHAWKLAPDGCEIRALCNMSTLRRDIKSSNELVGIITDFKGTIENLGDCFSNAERKTNVEVAFISLTKPVSTTEEDWSEYFNYEINDTEQYAPGLMRHDAVTEIVGRYVGSLKMFKTVEEMSDKINDMMKPINMRGISFGCTTNDDRTRQSISFEQFKVELQKNAWNTVFHKMNMGKYMTQTLKEKISKFVEQQSHFPFTVSNIYDMLRFISDTNGNRMEEVLIQVFESLTKHYDDNRYAVEGWKTNSHYMINEKIIIPYMVGPRYKGGYEMLYNGNVEKINDLTKALCYITGITYETIGCLSNWVSRTQIIDNEYYQNSEEIKTQGRKSYHYFMRLDSTKVKFTEDEWIDYEVKKATEKKEASYIREWGVWYEWGFFKVKAFKKGTMHLIFKDKKVWELFNRKVAEAKGFELPEKI